jgi:lantibiotic biosynthesis protein
MKNTCEKKLLEILSYYSEEKMDPSNPYLMGGTSGLLLLLSHCYKHFYCNDEELINEILNETWTNPVLATNMTFCTGISGFYWILVNLHERGLIDDTSMAVIDFKKMEQNSFDLIDDGNYDFLHGCIGISYSLLYMPRRYYDNIESYTQKILEELTKRMDNESGMIHDFDFVNNKSKPNKINLGLAHGIPSVLKYSLECYKKNVCPVLSKGIAEKVIDYIITHANSDKNESYYGYAIEDEHIEDSIGSRLAWCYGDLTIAYILYQASVVLSRSEIGEYAMEIFSHCLLRKEPENTGVFDAGFCHGSAGIAHIYNKMWHQTGDDRFKKATEYWLAETLNYSQFEDGIIGYKKFDPELKGGPYVSDPSLLEGTIGIALVLFSYLTNDFDWDYCMLLN